MSKIKPATVADPPTATLSAALKLAKMIEAKVVLVVVVKDDWTTDMTMYGDEDSSLGDIMLMLGGAMSATRAVIRREFPGRSDYADKIEQAMALVGVSDDETHDPSKKAN